MAASVFTEQQLERRGGNGGVIAGVVGGHQCGQEILPVQRDVVVEGC